MRVKSILALVVVAAVLFLSTAYARLPNYQYYIPVDVYNPNQYPIYKYPVIFELNVQQYTLSDYNDIRIEYVHDGQATEINYSKEVLGGGVVRLYAYVDEIPADTTVRLLVYVGRENDTDHSIPFVEAVGEYMAVRFKDAYLDGSAWTPYWSEIKGCNDRVWEDGGRDAFDNFLYPKLVVNGISKSLYASPYANCNPYYLSIGSLNIKYENYAYGYATESAPHSPGSAHQRVWVQEILPRCDARNNQYNIYYEIQGNLGSDNYTRGWEYNTTILGSIQVKYYQTNDESDPNGNTRDPQIHYFVMVGDGQQHENYNRRGEHIVHSTSYYSTPHPITYMLFVGDVHEHVEDFLSESAYFGEPCYIDEPLEYNIGDVVYLGYFHATVPATVYRSNTYDINVLYDGNYWIKLATDWGYEANVEKVEENLYTVQLYVDTTVPVGWHTVSFDVGGYFDEQYSVYVEYGGVPEIVHATYSREASVGGMHILAVDINCTRDRCDTLRVTAHSTGCIVRNPEHVLTGVDVGETRRVMFEYICYNAGEYNIVVTAQTPAGSDTEAYNISVVVPRTEVVAQISSPDVVSQDDNVLVTVTANGYEGNVAVSLLDANQNQILSTVASPGGSGIYYATIHVPNVDDGQYVLLAAGDSFTVARVLVVSSHKSTNRYGIPVEDEHGKPASMLFAEVSGDALTYVVNLRNIRSAPLTVSAADWLSDGGILELPQEFISTISTLSVVGTDNNRTYAVEFDASGGGISIVWHDGDGYLTLEPGDNQYRVTILSPYVDRLRQMCETTGDPTICNYLQQALDANYAHEQANTYHEAMQYLQSAVYGGITVDVAVPPTVAQEENAQGFVYIYNRAGSIDPATTVCEIVDDRGSVVSSCTLDRESAGVYRVSLYTDTNGTFGVKVCASIGEFSAEGVAYYQVLPKREEPQRKMVGGGGGGSAPVAPIKIVYKAGKVYVAIPEHVPPGDYVIQYTGELYRYVKSPAPGDIIKVDDRILSLELHPFASGILSGEVQLRRGSRVYRIKLDIVADDRLNQVVGAKLMDGKIRVDVPDGGAKVVFKGPIEHCVSQDTFYFRDGGTRYIKTNCSADGVVVITPNTSTGLSQATIQITLSQRQSIVQAADILHTTIIPMAVFFVLAVIVSHLRLI